MDIPDDPDGKMTFSGCGYGMQSDDLPHYNDDGIDAV
jgi:hypothetical protein